MGEVLPWRQAKPEPEPTEGKQYCQCGHDKMEIWSYGTIVCAECKEVQGARWLRVMRHD